MGQVRIIACIEDAGVIKGVFDQMDEVRARVEQKLPDNFPSRISDAVFNGMQIIKNRCRS